MVEGDGLEPTAPVDAPTNEAARVTDPRSWLVTPWGVDVHSDNGRHAQMPTAGRYVDPFGGYDVTRGAQATRDRGAPLAVGVMPL